MSPTDFDRLNAEIEQFDRILKASEKWGSAYEQDPKTHAEIIKLEARWQRIIRKLFRDFSEDVMKYFNWNAYYGLVRADYTVDVVVDDTFYDALATEFIKVSFETLSTAIATGAQSGENIYKKPYGLNSTDEIIQKLTTEQLAYLVGKRVDKSGKIVDNPRPEYSITDKARKDITQAVQTSINLGEDRNDLVKRLKATIANPKRAETIAQTESVNAFATGLLHFGDVSGATGKEWDDVFATDICKTFADKKIVPLNYLYGDKHKGPAAHPGCRCSLRMVYDNEYLPPK